MKNLNLAFIDSETTGLDSGIHEIIEIGCILVRQVPRHGAGPAIEVIEEWEAKVKPERLDLADPKALKINGYNEAAWQKAATLSLALKDLSEKAMSAMAVGQNVFFDLDFLTRGFRKTGIANPFFYKSLDLASMAFAKLYNEPALEQFSLRTMGDYFGVVNERAHSALSDARATLAIYRKLLGV